MNVCSRDRAIVLFDAIDRQNGAKLCPRVEFPQWPGRLKPAVRAWNQLRLKLADSGHSARVVERPT